MDVYEKLVPSPTTETQPYWDGLNEARLLLQRCADCGKIRHYPRPVCDACWSMNAAWIDASGRGRVCIAGLPAIMRFRYPGFRRVDLPIRWSPIVDLDEGVRMNAQLRKLDPGGTACGLAVRIAFEEATDRLTLPVFVPASGWSE